MQISLEYLNVDTGAQRVKEDCILQWLFNSDLAQIQWILYNFSLHDDIQKVIQ